MKRIFPALAFLLFLQLSPFRAQAQDNVIKLNPLSAFALTGWVSYERVLLPAVSAQGSVFFTGVGFFGTRIGGFGFTPEVRFYPSGQAPNGFYVAPYYRYQRFSARIRGVAELANFSQNGGGVLVGRQWVIADLITFEAFLGGGYMAGKPQTIDQSGNLREHNIRVFGEGVRVRGGLTVGFRF